MFLQTKLVSTAEFWRAQDELGSVYFIRDAEADAIKVGYSRDPLARLSNLQVGSSRELKLVGLIAAPETVEPIIHRELYEGRLRGEWFWDRGVTTEWLMDMTRGEPLYRNVWRLVPGQQYLMSWDATTKTHTKHLWDRALKEWVPPIPPMGCTNESHLPSTLRSISAD